MQLDPLTMCVCDACVLQSAYEQLRRNGAFDEVRIIVKREKAAHKVVSHQHAQFPC